MRVPAKGRKIDRGGPLQQPLPDIQALRRRGSNAIVAAGDIDCLAIRVAAQCIPQMPRRRSDPTLAEQSSDGEAGGKLLTAFARSWFRNASRCVRFERLAVV